MTQRRKVLWVSRFCLMDTTSGASLAVREMLKRLIQRGFDVSVLGMTTFDQEAGRMALAQYLDRPIASDDEVIRIKDEGLTHQLVRTKHWFGKRVTTEEQNVLFSMYQSALKKFDPDLVWTYGGAAFDMMFPYEAKRLGKTTAGYLANGNYYEDYWCKDIDHLLTTSHATAQLYKDRFGLKLHPVGVMIAPEKYVAETHTWRAVTMVNPSFGKGGALVAQVALDLEERRPDIPFTVVESRGTWSKTLRMVTQALGAQRSALKNVTVQPHTSDMRPIYADARVILMPSLWWEAAGRVLAEGALNGVPAIVTNNGGPPEMVGDGGVRLTLPERFYERPYKRLMSASGVREFASVIERFFDDEDYFAQMSQRARAVAAEKHDIEKNADNLARLLHGFCSDTAA